MLSPLTIYYFIKKILNENTFNTYYANEEEGLLGIC